MNKYLLFVAGFFMMLSCSVVEEADADLAVNVHWSLDSIDVDNYRTYATLSIENTGRDTLGSDWTLFYSQFASVNDKGSDPRLDANHITGDYHRIAPSDMFDPVSPGEGSAYQLQYNGIIQRVSDAPHGVYLVDGNELVVPVEFTATGINASTLAALNPPTAASRHRENAMEQPAEALPPILPTPVSYQRYPGAYQLKASMTVTYPELFRGEAQYLEERLLSLGTTVDPVADGQADIVLEHDMEQQNEEGYILTSTPEQVVIRSATGAGIFYGMQTLLSLVPLRAGEDAIGLPCVRIEDNPRFGYRGLHVDISRNFHSVAHLKRIIDQMAYFKLNRLHLTLTNDEGWRLEIPGLPELTDVGAFRGHTVTEQDHLFPAYGSGSDPKAPDNNGSGYYTRSEFIDLLKYAATRWVMVIPEIDVPGHARAAIKAMRVRESRLATEGNMQEATRFKLDDPDDTSVYRSAQNYSDNVICVCRESTYAFIDHVVSETVKMYEEADVPLLGIHSGGDEVPVGVWQDSPICAEWISNKRLSGPTALGAYFQQRFIDILARYDLTAAGWEEIVLAMTPDGHNTTEINMDFIDQPVLPYVWNAVWGWGREDMAYRLANAGYPIVICNSAALYFDLAYDKDPEERGLSWSGFVDTRTTFDFQPLEMFTVASTDMHGNPLDAAHVQGMERLDRRGEDNVLGIQGQLWGETLVDSDLLDYYLFPKMLALAQRAWIPRPGWINAPSIETRQKGLDQDWDVFATTVGQEILPQLDVLFGGVNYRIPLPGAIIRNDTLYANVRFPGLEIVYTTDGSDPTGSSQQYTGPVKVLSETVKLRAMNSRGRLGRIAEIGN